MNKFTTLIAVVILSAFASTANAVPITGRIDITGVSQAIDDGTTAIGIDFLGGYTITSLAGFTPTGTYAPLLGTSPAITMNDFLFTDATPITIWSFTESGITYSFDLGNITSVADATDLTGFKVRGTGVLKVTNFDDTNGSWVYTQSGISFSSENVPEPAIALLLATGLIGFGFARRARKAA